MNNLDLKKFNFHILIIDDDEKIRLLLKKFLENNEFRVSDAESTEEAKKIMESLIFDLLVVDIMMPGQNGLDFLKEIRKTSQMPVLMLTAMSDPEDRLDGLEIGADDYMTKPFSFKELLARIKALLRRSKPNSISNILEFEDLKLDRLEKRVYRKKTEITLGPTEYRLIEFFLTNPKRVFTRDQILENVWPNNINVETRTIDVHIRRLRKSININNNKELIRTVRSSGYSLI